MQAVRRRLPYLCALFVLCAAGLLARRLNAAHPGFFTAYFPDAAWTMAVYCGFGLLFCKDARLHFPAALGVSLLIEVSQLWHPPFLEALRATTLGGLVLGFGFLWSDLICYAVGACVCALTETIVRRKCAKNTCKESKDMVG